MQQPMQQGGQQVNSYPKSKDEVDRFVASLISLIHDENTRPQIMKQIANTKVPVYVRIGNAVSQVLTVLLKKVMDSTGRKPNIKLILNAIKSAVREISAMANIAGVKSTPEDRKKAAGMAGQLIDSGMSGKGQQQPTEQGPPQNEMQQGLMGVNNG